MIRTKSLTVNMAAALLIGASFLLPEHYAVYFLSTGLFALSGALTNHLAIHMLFERVPFLYGSGVIVLRFESFKSSIKQLMMAQFFTREQLDGFFAKEEKQIDLAPVIERTDFSVAYDALAKTVMESSFGGMLGMFGGDKALEGLREPFTAKMKSAVLHITASEAFKAELQNSLQDSSLSQDMLDAIEDVIDARLEEVTPEMVKEMVLELMREHLGWLVVWGGVVGGAFGLLSALLF